MRVLYLSQYFPPEVGATQTRAYEMARHLVTAGHQVTMLTEVPNHPSGIIPSEYRGRLYERSDLEGIDVIRVWVKASPVKTFASRMAFYLTYMVNAILAGLLLARGRYDAIYATSPPLFVGGAALVLSYSRRIPLLFEVRDLWPESAVVLGEMTDARAVRLAGKLEEMCYNRARCVVVVTEGIRRRLEEQRAEIQAVEEQEEGLHKEFLDSKEERRASSQRFSEARQRLEPRRQEMTRLEQRHGNANDELDSVSRRQASLAESERELDTQIQTLESDLAEREGLLSQQEPAVKDLQGDLGTAEEELAKLRALTQSRQAEFRALG